MNRPQAGDRISNYLLDELIGEGSFGEVWKAHHHVFNDLVAIKIPTDAQYVRHLQREGLAVHGLRDPHIVRVLDLDPYADRPYLIMEYVDGPSLRTLIDNQPKGLPIPAVVAILHGVLSALRVAHEARVIHRDIKPANILIRGGGDLATVTPDRAKVTDFGLGHVSDAGMRSIVQSGSMSTEAGRRITGTLVYMSPEQRDGQEIDARSDLYSVGVVLHEMLTGVLPQGSDLPSALRRDVPRWLDQLFERCYTRRDRRYASAAEMQAMIEHYGEPVWAWSGPGAGNDARVRQVGNRWVCAACQGVVNRDDQFCIHCGRQLADHVPRCVSCHGFVGHNDNFCILCGTNLQART